MSNVRMDSNERSHQIVMVAYKIAVEEGLHSITAGKVAEEVGITRALVHHYFRTIADLQTEVVNRAIMESQMKIVGHAVAIKHPATDNLSDDVKKAAIAAIL